MSSPFCGSPLCGAVGGRGGYDGGCLPLCGSPLGGMVEGRSCHPLLSSPHSWLKIVGGLKDDVEEADGFYTSLTSIMPFTRLDTVWAGGGQ